ncbi:MAG: hypothetical protein ACOYN3_10470, partial [Acidimicrobiia bacterium]
MVEDLGPRNAQVARLRKLLSDRATRRDAGVFVAEGVRCIDGLFDRHANVRALYIDADAHERSGELRVRAEAAAIPVMQLASGVGRRLGATVT